VTTALANPAKMIEKGAPHIIHNEAQLEAYTEALFKLTAFDQPTPAQTEAIDLLTLLIERYEQEHYPVPAATPVSVVKFLQQSQGLTQRDLVPEFGSESAVSMFLSGKRKINLQQIRNLSKRFNLPADIFMEKAG
jgi:HTH-type transcriptional regulator / antitoxin HigA